MVSKVLIDFLRKVWQFAYQHHALITTVNQTQNTIDWSTATPEQQSTRCEIHRILKQARYDIERLQLNTVISAAMKILNVLIQLADNTDTPTYSHLVQDSFSILLRLLAPITPHITQALWQILEYGDDISHARWPKPAADALKTNTVTLMVQVNGKLRGKIQVPIDADDDNITTQAQQQVNVAKFIADKPCKKVIIVPGKLVNIVVGS